MSARNETNNNRYARENVNFVIFKLCKVLFFLLVNKIEMLMNFAFYMYLEIISYLLFANITS